MQQKKTTKEEYQKCVNVVVEYINQHLGEDIDLKSLARISNFSPFYFHRIMKAFLGEPIGTFIVRTRTEAMEPGRAFYAFAEHDAIGFACEDEDLAAFTHSAGFENKLTCLRNEHEVADNVRMGDSNGPALLNLLFKKRNNGTIATQDIAETSGDKLGFALYLTINDSLIKALAINLTDALGATHDVGGVNGLIGGDHHELLGAVLNRQVGNDASTCDIVADGLNGVVLHHGHVLIGGRMEDILRTMFSKKLLHVVFIGNGSDDSLILYIGKLTRHHQTDIVHWCFCLINKDHFGKFIRCYLAHHFRTNRTCSTCDEYTLSR